MEGLLLLLGQRDHHRRRQDLGVGAGGLVHVRSTNLQQAAAGGDLRHALHAPLPRLRGVEVRRRAFFAFQEGRPAAAVNIHRELDRHRHAAGQDRRAAIASHSEVVGL